MIWWYLFHAWRNHVLEIRPRYETPLNGRCSCGKKWAV